MAINGNRKGKVGERLTALDVREAFPWIADQVRRGWQSRKGSDDPDVIGLPKIWLESKKGRQPNPRGALAQAAKDSKGRGHYPVAVIRDDRSKPFVVLYWADFLELIRPFVLKETERKTDGTEANSVREGRGRQDVRADPLPGRTWRVRL